MLDGRLRSRFSLHWRGFGHLGGRRAAFGGTHVLLGLGAIFPNILLHDLGGMSGLLSSHLLHLIGLGVERLMGKLDLAVDELAIVDID